MDVHVVIGKEFFEEAEVRITAAGIEVSKPFSTNNQNDVEMMKIAIENYDDKPEINIGEYATSYAKEEVTNLINNFTPLKTRSTNVKINIILKDESPIYSNQ